MVSALLLIAGIVLLFFSGNWLVKSGVQIARHFKVSTLVVGMTVVAFGTSAPEFIVSLKGVYNGSPDISVGNVVGSNIANIALVLGAVAMVLPIRVKNPQIFIDWLVMMFATILFWGFSYDGNIEFYEGIILIVILLVYIVLSIKASHKKSFESKTIEAPTLSMGKSIGLFAVACVGLYFGSQLLVDNAVKIAQYLNVSERVIGVTIVAFGTSVPELAASLIAAFKKETEISIGNIIGSNLFNILGTLGITSLFKTINVSSEILNFDVYWMIGTSILLILTIIPVRNGIINRREGFMFLMVYAAYIYFTF